MPIRVNISPSIPARIPRSIFPEERMATMVRAKKQIPKFSAGVNFRAMSAKDGAQKVRMIKENTEPRNENTIPSPKAFMASPFWAMG